MSYQVNPLARLIGPRGHVINCSRIEQVVRETNIVLKKLISFDGVDIMGILGLRNLSAAVGEIFVKEMEREYTELMKNPHQDGYPDLLLLDDVGKNALDKSVEGKGSFSPFSSGGFEVKATCGSVRPRKECEKRGLKHPRLGDQRINVLLTHDWKSHHRQTNNLIGLLWDFIDDMPVIVAVFYSNTLDESDWGKIVTPKEGEGRTTSVSILKAAGINKMSQGWIVMLDSQPYSDYVVKRIRRN